MACKACQQQSRAIRYLRNGVWQWYIISISARVLIRNLNGIKTSQTEVQRGKDSGEMGEKQTVCVTGAGGYVASWLVKQLLSRDYIVHGTLRDPGDEKNAHLKKLENAEENLKLFKADLLDYQSLSDAMAGCIGVFHVACPVPYKKLLDPQGEMIEPAVTGTRNVLNACLKAEVKKVVVVSSIAAISFNPNYSNGEIVDEKGWSDKEYCKSAEAWYYLGKTVSEEEAWEFAARTGLNMVTICPSYVFGPLLQPTMNASCFLLLTLLKDGHESMENRAFDIVDVREVAEALILLYENPEAKGRYICSSYIIKLQDLANKIRSMFNKDYNIPKSFTEPKRDTNVSSEKLQNLGWKYRPMEETLTDAVKHYEENGFLS